MELIDVHSHIVPASFPANPSPGDNPRWPCLCGTGQDRAVIEIAGKAFRELDARSWNVDRRLDDMARAGVTAQVLSPMPELLSYWFSPTDGLEMARHVNHVIADMRARAPRQFHGLGTVPLQDVGFATRELARLKSDGFAGVEIGSNINGVVLGDARFEEFYAEAARLGLALFVHALHPVGSDRLAAFPDLVPYAAFPLDTGLAAASLIRAGVLARYPQLRIGLSHGGGAIVPLVYRLQHGWELSRGFDGTLALPPREQARCLYYDSLVYDVPYLGFLLESFAPGKVFAGTDYPYPIEQTKLAAFVSRAPAACHPALLAGAARRFLGID